jgi:hypothetical protein
LQRCPGCPCSAALSAQACTFLAPRVAPRGREVGPHTRRGNALAIDRVRPGTAGAE